ncbi:hypothetical protein [Limnobacter sp.]|uniref:hypothetical protein n=1 Tax=Limnobacter sp. TaxID=2003368 RepID=UPI0027336B7D|nr:hypothetical protein [Limnobacter sp.]MDP3189211.1 hypothetical protein [Limnobacter sp.]
MKCKAKIWAMSASAPDKLTQVGELQYETGSLPDAEKTIVHHIHQMGMLGESKLWQGKKIIISVLARD